MRPETPIEILMCELSRDILKYLKDRNYKAPSKHDPKYRKMIKLLHHYGELNDEYILIHKQPCQITFKEHSLSTEVMGTPNKSTTPPTRISLIFTKSISAIQSAFEPITDDLRYIWQKFFLKDFQNTKKRNPSQEETFSSSQLEKRRAILSQWRVKRITNTKSNSNTESCKDT